MAQTLHSQDVNHYRASFSRPNATFDNKVMSLRALFTMQRLGLKTRRWAQKQLQTLQQDPWISPDPVEQARRASLIDLLINKNELAIKKCSSRIENKRLKEEREKAPAAPAKEGATPWD